jgi:hypothetical protein
MSDFDFEKIRRDIAAFEAGRARAQVVGRVRGRSYLDWSSTIDQLKRDGKLEDAVELAYECMDAAERANAAQGYEFGAAGWYKIVAVILRKMKDYETEVRVLERGTPFWPSLEPRLKKARELAAKAASN